MTVEAASQPARGASSARESLAEQTRVSSRLRRPRIDGKFLAAGDETLYVLGVTYGPFAAADEDGGYDPVAAAADFAAMRARGVNAIRLYSVPPRWLLDAAGAHGIRVLVGLPWEQHVAFLDDRGRARDIERRVREAVRACGGHEAVLAYAVGNEIPAQIARWHGRRRVERFLARLCAAAKEEDPDGLVTYVNFPSTEYLRMPFCDLVAFNVYLERRDRFEAYLGRLQNLADDRPLVMTELGLDSRRNGHWGQAESLEWQLRSCFEAGCAGTFAFSWTDQWHRGGYEILDWDFGLLTRDRHPKPAADTVARVYADPLPATTADPLVTVAVCTHNGAATLGACLDAIANLDYPRYETVVVDDGSTDGSEAIAAARGVGVISTPNRGLAAARNSALAAAAGEIVAYVDDDAAPHREWLRHLTRAFETTPHAAVGGPNIVPADAGAIERCVAHAPGGPTHVLVSDREAEHVPGCNLAVRREVLERIGGFDPQFRAAGDDVDVCWRLREAGHTVGFAPGAQVWHRRRSTVRGYLRQQAGYGAAEALLERKWPEKYSPAGHVTWNGRLYGNGAAQHRGGWRWRVYYGGWGTGFFQSIYGPRRSLLESLPLMPEWYLVIAVLALISVGAIAWAPLLAATLLLAVALGALLVDAALGAARATEGGPRRRRWRLRALTGALYLLQPLARLYGRLRGGLTPLRHRGPRALASPLPRTATLWSEEWVAVEDRVRALATALRDAGSVVTSGGDWDRWDLEVRGGLLGRARMRIAVEEHGAGRQLVRARTWPWLSRLGALLPLALGLLGAVALAIDPSPTAAAVFGILAALVGSRAAYECAGAAAAVRRVIRRAVEDLPARGQEADALPRSW
jgi:O-antigen biosynthesis protein